GPRSPAPERSRYVAQVFALISSSFDDSAALIVGARIDHLRGARQRPSRDFTCKSARYDVVALDVDSDELRLMRLERPEQAPASLIPEPQRAIAAAGHHQTIGCERCVGEQPRAPSVDSTELARGSIPQPGGAI